MKKIFSIALLIFLAGYYAGAQDKDLYEKHEFIFRGDTLLYRLLLPENYNPGKTYPMVLFLHGSGERGNDNEAQLIHGGNLFLRDSIRNNYPAIIVFPQCPAEDSWVNMKASADSMGKRFFIFNTTAKPTTAMRLLLKLVKNIIAQYPITKRQLYVGGLSMGGMGTYELVRRQPSLFIAAFPICGAADLSIVPKLKKVHWWIFHGEKDESVNPQYSKTMVTALQKINVPVNFKFYAEAAHNSWDNAFAEPELMAWLFSNKK